MCAGCARSRNVGSKTRLAFSNAHRKVGWRQKSRVSNCVRERRHRSRVRSPEEGDKASSLRSLGLRAAATRPLSRHAPANLTAQGEGSLRFSRATPANLGCRRAPSPACYFDRYTVLSVARFWNFGEAVGGRILELMASGATRCANFCSCRGGTVITRI